MYWSFLNQKILLVNGNQVDFVDEIKYIGKIDDLLLILTWNGSIHDIEKQPINNVYGINEKGNIVWNIKDILKCDGIYLFISINKFNRLEIVNSNSKHHDININEGKIY